MKNKQLKSVITLIAIELIVFGILFLVGFKFTYQPKLENDWNAISAVGQWVGVVITGILTAIIIWQTQKNSKRDLNLNLLNKRREIFSVLKNFLEYCEHYEEFLVESKRLGLLDRYKFLNITIECANISTARLEILEDAQLYFDKDDADKIEKIKQLASLIHTMLGCATIVPERLNESQHLLYVKQRVNEVLEYRNFINIDLLDTIKSY